MRSTVVFMEDKMLFTPWTTNEKSTLKTTMVLHSRNVGKDHKGPWLRLLLLSKALPMLATANLSLFSL